MKKLALCVGKNNYAGSAALRGCVNDARDIAALLVKHGWNVVLLLDSAATVANCKKILEDFAKRATSANDKVFWSLSSHGTRVKDLDGDEEDGYDEAVYLDRTWVDDDINVLLRKFKNCQVGVFTDCCFSGTTTRATIGISERNYGKARYIEIDKISPRARRRRRFMLPPLDIGWWHISGCAEDEYSYDAIFDGRYNGACSYYFLQSIEPYLHVEKVHAAIRKNLLSNKYPQSPLLEGLYVDRYLIGESDNEGSIEEIQPVCFLKRLINKLFKR